MIIASCVLLFASVLVLVLCWSGTELIAEGMTNVFSRILISNSINNIEKIPAYTKGFFNRLLI